MSTRKKQKTDRRTVTIYLRSAEAIRVLDSLPAPARNKSHLIELALLAYAKPKPLAS